MSAVVIIDSRTERQTLDRAGNLVPVIVVTYHTMEGSSGTLEITKEKFHALAATSEGLATLKDMIQAEADALDALF